MYINVAWQTDNASVNGKLLYMGIKLKKRGEKEMNLRDSKKRKTSNKLFYKK